MSETDTDPAADRLVELYREHIGEPDRRTDVYLGFAAFFAGLGLGLVGLVLFGIERALVEGEVFWLREIAFAAGALGLPVVLVSVVVLLPADRRATYVALAGLVVTVGAVAFFVSVYPSDWNYGEDYSLQGVTVYAVGLVGVLSATAAALVSYHVERVRGVPTGSGAPAGSGTAAATADVDRQRESAEVTEEQVRQDIDEAMADTEISWGGVEKVETEQLTVNTDADLEGVDLDQSSATVHRSAGVDDAVSGLKGLQGGEARTDSQSGGVDEQAEALRELREQKRREAEAEPDGVVDRVRSLLDR